MKPRAVIDTNVLFEGLTHQGSAAALIVEAWLHDLFQPCVSTALAYEYVDVLLRHLSAQRWQTIQPLLSTLLGKAAFVEIYFTWRPMSPDPGDDHVIDCVMNAAAPLITANIKDFRQAQHNLGLRLMTPLTFVTYLANQPQE